MKSVLAIAVLAFLPTAHAIGVSFEVTPGCIFSKSTATCIVENKSESEVVCDVTMTVTTFTNQKYVVRRAPIIQAQRFDDSLKFWTPSADVIVSVTTEGTCTINQP